ncbi:hypothetical protein ACLK2E_16910 [Escherichia coli]
MNIDFAIDVKAAPAVVGGKPVPLSPVMTLKNDVGKNIEVIPQRVGFRDIKVRNGRSTSITVM